MMLQEPPAAIAPAEDAQALYERGVALRRAGRNADALPLLRRAAELRPDDADVLLQYGLSLYGAGRLREAQRVLDRAQALAPNYADVSLARARVAAALNDRTRARALAGPLATGGNTEAAALLRTLDAPADVEAEWRVDAWASYSELSSGDRWDAQGLAVSRRVTSETTLTLSVERTRRFDRTDVYVEGAAAHDFGRWSGWVSLGGAPDADHRAEVSAAVGATTRGWTVGGGRLRPLIEARWSEYPTGPVRTVQPGLAWDGERASLEARGVFTRDELGQDRSGWLVRGGWQVTDRVRLEASYADAPESSGGVTLDVRATALGVRLKLTETTDLRLVGVHEDRGPSGDRREGLVALTRRF